MRKKTLFGRPIKGGNGMYAMGDDTEEGCQFALLWLIGFFICVVGAAASYQSSADQMKVEFHKVVVRCVELSDKNTETAAKIFSRIHMNFSRERLLGDILVTLSPEDQERFSKVRKMSRVWEDRKQAFNELYAIDHLPE